MKVSPEAVADTMGGVVLVREVPGQDDDAAPLEVHVRGEGVGLGVTRGVDAADGLAVAWAVPPLDEPQAERRTAAAISAPIFTTRGSHPEAPGRSIKRPCSKRTFGSGCFEELHADRLSL